jgi:hypothetical protein
MNHNANFETPRFGQYMPSYFRSVKRPDSTPLAGDAFFRMVTTDSTMKSRTDAARKAFLAGALLRRWGIACIECYHYLFSPACPVNKMGSSEEEICVLHRTYRKRPGKCEHTYLKPTGNMEMPRKGIDNMGCPHQFPGGAEPRCAFSRFIFSPWHRENFSRCSSVHGLWKHSTTELALLGERSSSGTLIWLTTSINQGICSLLRSLFVSDKKFDLSSGLFLAQIPNIS